MRANDVVVFTLDGKQYVAANAPGNEVMSGDHRAHFIADHPDHVWVCRDEVEDCSWVIPPHAVLRVWVRSLGASA